MEADRIKPDPIDGLPATEVGEWSKDKHRLIEHYVAISGGARKNFLRRGNAGVTYIDLYCGSGRSFIRGTDEFIDGSPLVAWKASCKLAPFTEVHINDLNESLVGAAAQRLSALGAPVKIYGGKADAAVKRICANLNRYALHFALIDPFKLELPFSVFRELAAFDRMDMLIHISAMDLRRNWDRYVQSEHSPLDDMAPGWRSKVNVVQKGRIARDEFIRYWIDSLKNLGFKGDLDFELIRGPGRRPFYWLALVAKHDLAGKFWKKVPRPGKIFGLF